MVPKKPSGLFRVIHHLLFPQSESVNDGISEELYSVQYASFDCAVAMVQSFGKAAWLRKCNIKSAFWLLVHQNDLDQLVFQFEGQFYFDKALLVGTSILCADFVCFSSMLEWVIKEKSGLGVADALFS